MTTSQPLLSELTAAHSIIRNALNIMTIEQKLAWSDKNAADGVGGEGTTRANERAAVIAQGLPSSVGELWPEQGGTYAGVMFDHETGNRYHLIVSDDAGDLEDLAFGAYGEHIDGSDSTWDGRANTAALIAANSEHPAAQRIAALTIDGQSDWYLPSQRELALCWATVPHLFRKDGYWSSTQFSEYSAWYQSFGNGTQSYGRKDGELRARAVRRLVIE